MSVISLYGFTVRKLGVGHYVMRARGDHGGRKEITIRKFDAGWKVGGVICDGARTAFEEADKDPQPEQSECLTMAKYEVTTSVSIDCTVKLIVEADSREAAIDAAADILPSNMASDYRGRQAGWKADVKLKAPKGVEITGCKAGWIQSASGKDKARKIG